MLGVNEPGDDIRLQIEIRTVTVLQTDRSDAFLVHLDADVDSDGISDREEGTDDVDSDGTPNYLDEDSDGDGLPDSEEGIDDTDGDGTSNFRDPTDGTVETPTPTSTLTWDSTPTPTHVGTPSSGQPPDSSPEPSLSFGALQEGGLPWLLLVLLALAALVLGWRQIRS